MTGMPKDFQSPFGLCGRTVLVTGASSGIGKETCGLLARLGAKLVLTGRNAERLFAVQQSLSGETHVVEVFDLESGSATIPEWMKRIASTCGLLDGVVHCAGVHVAMPLMALKPQDFHTAFAMNVVAGAMLARGLRQRAVRGSNPALVFVSSIAGLVGAPGASPYSASKGALTALMRSLALELAAEHIRVNCVAPGFVQTEMTERFGRTLTEQQMARIKEDHPLGIGMPADVANAIAFLLADSSRWITGSTLVVDGGYTAK